VKTGLGLSKDEQMTARRKSPHSARIKSKTQSTYPKAPPEIRGLDLALPPDVSLGVSYTDWGPDVRFPEKPKPNTQAAFGSGAQNSCLAAELRGALSGGGL
jgi:hypothetical protein